jgi:hypothetical protein
MSEQPIQIEPTRTGGFAGQRLHGSVRTDALAPQVAAEITDLVEGADLAGLERRATGAQVRPDEFRYELTVVRGADRHQLTVLDHEVTPALRPLLTRLVELARQG